MSEQLKAAGEAAPFAPYDEALAVLHGAKDDWARLPSKERVALLEEVKDALMAVAEDWALAAGRQKQLPADSPLVGEEWISGPYALMAGCNGLIHALSMLDGKEHIDAVPTRTLPTGQLAAKVMPHSFWDQLLLSGVTAEIWMQQGVNKANLKDNVAGAHDVSPAEREGKVALVLGAGNIAAIAPLDVFHKLFVENQVALLKMNPVNDYLTPFLEQALAPLIRRGLVRVMKGGGAEGAYLCNHPLVDEIHITGSQATHDLIVWGPGEEGERNRRQGTPRLGKKITSELGAVCPTIVVPGPWSQADIAFQAEHLATQKLHNSGFNCIACQVLVMPKGWAQGEALLAATKEQIARSTRPAYYPGAEARLEAFAGQGRQVEQIRRGQAPALVMTKTEEADYFRHQEVFAPALSVTELEAEDAESYLRSAIRYANEQLHGTLGANILIHPKTLKALGRARFEAIIAELRYGTIAVNAWSGLGFLLATCPWGAFPGHTLADAQSGIGHVHNCLMFDKVERCVVEAPFRPFPRGLLSGQFSLLPRPPWFITHSRQHQVGKLLVAFQYRPSWFKLPRIFFNALLG
ncbi:aldehyde dehydrogenase family protein [Gallaecimonas kandeliae]|uniref:aldehyde dehydrogenase family protein n=1 Tax=Gallaecimonas kandeliae TaxID=3029055 RepID=UPI00264A3263|nr:aldehyde dehydrogenase family protein [Gallaecimonas kandeliae]WKE64057.1 aldehyde dehydrogenase family protein [Gallaecimonas kandeliae]